MGIRVTVWRPNSPRSHTFTRTGSNAFPGPSRPTERPTSHFTSGLRASRLANLRPAITGDIDLAADLIKRIIVLGRGPDQAEFGLASAACLSGAALVRQIDARFARLLDVAADDGALERFLRLEYEPAVGLAVRRAETAIDREGGDFTQVLDPPFRTLSPSDFGFHNALRKRDGGLVFVDFEYFGWDDPAKMVADFLWHPGMDLPTELRARFYDATRSIIAGHGDSRFEHRVRALYPLFGLCWCLILLNEFLPEGWARRSSGRSANHAEAKPVSSAAPRTCFTP